MEITKSHLRKTILHYRQLLSEEEFTRRNDSLIRQTHDFLESTPLACIHIFLAIKRQKEPDVQSMLPVLWKKRCQTVTSVMNLRNKTMQHFYFDANTDFITNQLGIPEPQSAVKADLSALDGVFVPLLLADKTGDRIGYGGGFYDRFLSETNAMKIGLSLSNPADKILQSDPWDVPLDFLITPFKIYSYG